MGKIYKIFNIVLMFALIGVIWGQCLYASCLRVPMSQGYKREGSVAESMDLKRRQVLMGKFYDKQGFARLEPKLKDFQKSTKEGVFGLTPPGAIKELFKNIPVAGLRFMSLGAGEGFDLVHAAAHGAMSAVGYEINEVVFDRGREVLRNLKKDPIGKQFVAAISLHKKSMFKASWGKADMLYYYEHSRDFEREIEDKALKEMNPGAMLVVLRENKDRPLFPRLRKIKTLRVKVDGFDFYFEIYQRPETMARLKKIISRIGNHSGPLVYYNIRPFDLGDFMNSVEESEVFKNTYSMDWGRFIQDLENNPESEAYDYLIKYLKPKHKTYVYRIMEQHRFIRKMVPGLLAQKIKARKGAEPVYVRLVTLAGGYDPISIGATLIESIERELKNKYPGLVFGRDVILEIQDVQLDPKVIKEIKETKEFTLEHTLHEVYNAPEEIKLHIKAINKNRAALMDIIKFRQGSIGDVRAKGLMADVLKDNPDLVICNLAFYHLDIPHQKECIDFVGRTASKNTMFIFAFEVHLLIHAADRYVYEFNGDRKIASQVRPASTHKKAYPPLFEKYFSIKRIPVGAIGSAFYVMRKKGPDKGQEVEKGLGKFAEEFQPIMDKIVEVTTEISGFTAGSEKAIVNDYPYGCVTSSFATKYIIEKLYGGRLTVQLVEVSHPEMDRLNIGRHVANIIVDDLTGRKYFMSFFEGIWDDSYPGERTREIKFFIPLEQMSVSDIPTPAYAKWFKEQEFSPVFFEFKEFKDITEATRLVVLGEYQESTPEEETTHIFNYIDAIINFNEWRALLDMDTDQPVTVPSRASRNGA